MDKIVLGTRGSALAIKQTELVQEGLRGLGFLGEIVVKTIHTSGDRKQGLGENIERDKLDWVQELEEAISAGAIDVAVHSGKDVPIEISPATCIVSVFTRADPRDALIYRSELGVVRGLSDLPSGAQLGTASLRRGAAIRAVRADFNVVPVRGNVGTRIGKLLDAQESLNAIVLASAGLERLGFSDVPMVKLSIDEMLPAVNQGILALQYAERRNDLAELVRGLSDVDTQNVFTCERECVKLLGADCGSAMGVFATREAGVMTLIANVMSIDGTRILIERKQGEDGLEVARCVGERLLAQGAAELL